MFLRYSLQVALQVALPEKMRFFKYICKSWSMTNDPGDSYHLWP